MLGIGSIVKDKTNGKTYKIIGSFFENVSFFLLENIKTNKTSAIEKVIFWQDFVW